MQRYYGLSVFCCLLVIGTTQADELKDVSAELVPIVEKHDVPSLVVAVVVDGKIVAYGAHGLRKTDSSSKVTVDDKYHLGSCTKAMTATLAAISVKSGKLKWDTTVSEIFPSNGIHKDFRNATLQQLVSNTAGCPKDVPRKLWTEAWANKGTARQQRYKLARGILEEAPEYEPGTDYEYSNAGFSIAGAMIEKVENKPWETLMRERIFKPLGMKSAGFRAPARNNKVDQPFGHNPKPVTPEPSGDNPRAIAPAGAVHASMTDWAKFAQLHLGVADNQLLSKEELAQLHKVRNQKNGYASGWGVTKRGWANGTVYTHTGSNTMWYSAIWVAPEKNFAVVSATNIAGDPGNRATDAACARMIGLFSIN